MYQTVAEVVAEQSYCVRKKVGAVVVTPTGILGIGFNGTAKGYPNQCELEDGTTHPLVIHAEDNALNKMAKEGISPEGAIVFITLAPCLSCAKRLAAVGVSAVYYRDHHREEAITHLERMGVTVKQW